MQLKSGLYSQENFGGDLSNIVIPPQIIAARVTKIILSIDDFENEDEKNFYGAYDALGMVFYTPVKNPSSTSPFQDKSTAYPLFPNLKNYPLLNEIVYIIPLPGKNILEDTNDIDNYYFSPMNLYQNVHQNGIPNNLVQQLTPNSQNKTNQEVEAGSINKTTGEEAELNLGKTFTERPIKDLQMFEGDVSLQGRWGNSLRFGSTVKSPLNDWSESGENGDAITIIRNGQQENDEEAWKPISENINEDKSSIYLTTSQKIPIEVASNSYNSYENAPTLPNEYVEDQVILNSGRLLFNSKSDSILLSSNQSINLNSINSVNIDTTTLSIQSDKILLGSKNATEAVLLGDKTVDTLKDIVTEVTSVFNQLQSLIGNMGVPFVPLNAAAIAANTKLEAIKNTLDQLKSKQNFTV